MLLVSLMLASEYMNQNPFNKLEVLKFSDGQEANQRQKRSSTPDGSQQTSTLTVLKIVRSSAQNQKERGGGEGDRTWLPKKGETVVHTLLLFHDENVTWRK